MFPTSTIRLTFFDRILRAQCSVKKSQSKCGSREHLKILPYNIMTLLNELDSDAQWSLDAKQENFAEKG